MTARNQVAVAAAAFIFVALAAGAVCALASGAMAIDLADLLRAVRP